MGQVLGEGDEADECNICVIWLVLDRCVGVR